MSEETRRWMQSDVRDDIKRFANWLKRNRKSVLVVLVWGIAMALITSKGIWAVYLENPSRFRLGLNISWGLLNVAEGTPRLASLDYVLFIAISLIAGLILNDIEIALYGYIAAVVVLFSVAFVHAFLFIWFVLPQQGSAIIDPGFITQIMWSAFLTVVRLVFPGVLLITFFSNLLGAFLGDLVQPFARGINARQES